MKKVVIIGERDLAEGFVTVKDMVSGAQEKISLEEFTKKISESG